MRPDAIRGCFVAGTDTGAGKTVLAAAITAAMRAAGVAARPFKPIVTGTDEPDPVWPADHELLGAVGEIPREDVSPWRFGPAVSPHLAAELASTTVEPRELVAAARRASVDADALVVEGVGGLLSPLARAYTVRDFAVDLGLPVVVAGRTGLGTISHSSLAVEAGRAAGLDIRAVVLGPWPAEPSVMERSNRDTIERLAGVAVVTLPRVRPDVADLARAGGTLPWESWLGTSTTM